VNTTANGRMPLVGVGEQPPTSTPIDEPNIPGQCGRCDRQCQPLTV
jgi:hypothetical protein